MAANDENNRLPELGNLEQHLPPPFHDNGYEPVSPAVPTIQEETEDQSSYSNTGHLVDNLVEATLGTATNSQADNNQLRASSNNQLPPRSASVPPSLRPARVPATNNGLPRRDQSPEIIFSNIAPSHNTGHNNNAATFRPAMQNRQRHVSTDNVHTRIQHAENRNTMGSSEGRHLVNLLTDEDSEIINDL